MSKILQYRKKHKKCKYCKHLRIINGIPGEPTLYICKAKDKIIRDMMPDMRSAPRIFCQCYEVRE